MNIIDAINDLIISEWIWGLTFGQWHIFISCLLMIITLMLFAKYSFLRAIKVSGLLHITSVFLYAAIVWIVMAYQGTVASTASANLTLESILNASLLLGLIYSIIQTIVCGILHSIGIRIAVYYIPILWISNSGAALLSYLSIRISMWHLL
jgi:hypothetical protein